MPRGFLFLIGSLFLAASNLCAGEERDRLLPTAEAEKLKLEPSQDGRAINITLKNLTETYTVTYVRLRAKVIDDSPALPQTTQEEMNARSEECRRKGQKGLCFLGFAPEERHPWTVEEKFTVLIAPKSTKNLYLEVNDKDHKVTRIDILEARGRETTWLERIFGR